MTASTVPIRAKFARDEFGHKYVAEYRWQWPDATFVTVAHVTHFTRHPDEDTSREYTEGERRALGLQWRYMHLVIDGTSLRVEWFATPRGTWVACGREHDSMTAAVQAIREAEGWTD